MASFSSINGVKMHANKALLTGWLKDQKGFDGFIISDWAAVKQLPGWSADQIATAINAGIDMVMVPDNYRDFIRDLTDDVKSGKVPLARIDDAVSRILSVNTETGACSSIPCRRRIPGSRPTPPWPRKRSRSPSPSSRTPACCL